MALQYPLFTASAIQISSLFCLLAEQSLQQTRIPLLHKVHRIGIGCTILFLIECYLEKPYNDTKKVSLDKPAEA